MLRACRWTAIALLAFGALASAASLASGYTLPLVLDEWDGADAPTVVPMPGTTVAPLAALDLDHGDWSAYLVLEYQDFREAKAQLRRSVLRLDDRAALKRLQRDLTAKYTGADIATVLSRLVLVRNGRVAYSTGIALDGSDLVGLQSPRWGFLKPERRDVRVGFASRFTPVYWPVVVLW